MRRVAIFRFHKLDYDDHRKRLMFFQKVNPHVPIYGVFGGDYCDYHLVRHNYNDLLVDIIFFREPDSKIKWSGGDILVQQWYKEIGHSIQFDFLHIVEWDLIFLDSLENWYSLVPIDTLGCTGVMPLHIIEHLWMWTSKPELRKEWLQLQDYVKANYDYSDKPYAIQGPAICYPKSFLEKLANVMIPKLSIDELRIPLFAQIFDFRIVDNRVYNWFSIENNMAFNCRKIPVNFETIEFEAEHKYGLRVFHPYVDEFDLDCFIRLHDQILKDH